ncbi:MAG: DNA damage-inducible protein D [Deltaproteobacteria bacterium]|nr:MAG: DNA damage-inducible protein D [Deltaproteobacteria bacterium]
MKKELITKLHEDFESVLQEKSGAEFWYARDLQNLLGYTEWRNFVLVIQKAKQACENSKQKSRDHFVDVNKMVFLGSGGERQVDDKGFGRIRSKGDAALFGGLSTQKMKEKIKVPAGRALSDFLPTITIKAKDFANEVTNIQVIQQNLKTENNVTQEHVKNNLDVRKILTNRKIFPEKLPPSEDVKKVERRLKLEEKKLSRITKFSGV